MTSSEIFEKFNWKEFIIDKVFNINTSKSLDGPELIEGDNIAYITRQNYNNGLQKYIKTPDSKYITSGNCLSLAVVGEVGITFYQSNDFTTSQNIINITIKNYNMTKNVGIFLSTTFEQLKKKYSYGKTLGQTRLKKETIWLPINDDGEPDYQFMEDYIKSISFSEILD